MHVTYTQLLCSFSAALQCPALFFACPNTPTCFYVAQASSVQEINTTCNLFSARLAILDSKEKMEGCLVPNLPFIGSWLTRTRIFADLKTVHLFKLKVCKPSLRSLLSSPALPPHSDLTSHCHLLHLSPLHLPIFPYFNFHLLSLTILIHSSTPRCTCLV